MNGPAFGSASIAASPPSATGTLSAKPVAMLGNALPFRLQLEASTAPLTPVGAGPVLQRDERFVVPSCLGDGFDPLGDEATGVTARGDQPARGEDDETADAPLPALPIIFDIPLAVTPSTSDAVTHRGSIEPGAAEVNERRDVPVQAFAVDTTRIPASTETGQLLAHAADVDERRGVPIQARAVDTTRIPASIETGQLLAQAADVDERRGVPVQAFAVDTTRIPASIETGQLLAQVPYEPRSARMAFAGRAIPSAGMVPEADAGIDTATSLKATRPDTKLYSPDIAPLPSAASAANMMAATIPSSKQGRSTADATDGAGERKPANPPANFRAVQTRESDLPNIISATPTPPPASRDAPIGSVPFAASTTQVEALIVDNDRIENVRIEPDTAAADPKRVDTAGSVATVLDRTKVPPSVTTPITTAPSSTQGERQMVTHRNARQIDEAVTGADANTGTQIDLPRSEQHIMARLTNPPAMRGERLYAAVNQPIDSDPVILPIPSALEAGSSESGRTAPMAGSPAQSMTVPPAGLQTVDAAAAQMQNFAGSLAQPTQPQPSASSAPAMFTPSAPIPFDRQFGQRIGSAIGSAMNTMSVKDGMLLLQISPERLGKIEIAIDRGSDRLQITTENEAVRGAIAQAHGRIEHELRSLGHRVGSIEVETRDTSTNTGSGHSQTDAQQQQQRGQENAAQQLHPSRPDARMRSHDRQGEDAAVTATARNRPSSNIFYA